MASFELLNTDSEQLSNTKQLNQGIIVYSFSAYSKSLVQSNNYRLYYNIITTKSLNMNYKSYDFIKIIYISLFIV